MRYLILAQTEVTAGALGAWLELLGEKKLARNPDDGIEDERVLHAREAPPDAIALKSRFLEISWHLSGWVEQVVKAGTEPIVIVDAVLPMDLNPVASPSGWNRLISLLILAFPEVRWVFGVVSGMEMEGEDEKNRWKMVEGRHSLSSLFDVGWDPLFDGSGLRAWVRRKAAQHNGGKVAPWIPQRNHWAAAIDDEAAYAQLHGYTAYRHGYRCFPVSSYTLGKRLFGKKEGRWKLGPCSLTLEDFYLGFPDKEEKVHLASLVDRKEKWPGLDRGQDGSTRHFITSGLGRSQGDENVAANRAYRRELRNQGRGGSEVAKPIPGIFGLWRDTGLARSLKDEDTETRRAYRGLAKGFFWPYHKHSAGTESGEGHSAPGLLLLVVDHLLGRAQRLCPEALDVRDAVRGAVLSISALELLGPKTPGTARLAVELKHRFEVLAECQSGGVQHGIELEERFAEIRREMRLLGQWYGIRAREGAVLNGEIAIVSRVKSIFGENEEFDEEEACRRRITILHRWLWMKKNRWNPLAWGFWPVRAYIEFMLGSLSRVALAIVAWILALIGIFNWISRHAEASITDGAEHPMTATKQAIFSFLGSPPADPNDPLWLVGMSIFASLAGFLHLGLLISLLYSKISRR